ncbi:extracellular solute-binding protein [Mesorhizobium sp.]|uniref:ABC transporter substrate-binding protein n=1 Tax=Mesorhizobium sp. TaxID=1871066 RepID=UPI000FE81113|nr:extracellular solute-binding protein [Mesorhizobium sp.]RWJ32010.1 MAG: extracellular solute-binding protein [Mesorhizobium sp.]TIQ73784.1 MAG: extracellular solute-binding protein [Mesorhizobium sp.]
MRNASNRSLSKRTRCLHIATALLMTTSVFSQAFAQAPEKPAALTLNVFSGVYESCFKKAVLPGFEAETGIKLNLATTQPPVAKLQAQADAPEIDVLIAGQSDMKAAHELGVVVDMDTALLANLPHVYAPLAGIGTDGDKRYSVVVTYNPTGLVYNAALWQNPPTSWFDLASDATPGVVNVRLPDSQNTVAWLAIMAHSLNGAWPEKLSDYDAVIKLMGEHLKPKLGAVLPSSGAMQSSFVDDPRSSLTVGPLNVALAMDQKYDLDIKWTAPKEGSYLITTEAGITKTPNNYWAHQLINYMLKADAQKAFAECGFYSPSNAEVVLGPEFDGKVIQGEDNVAKIMQIPWEKISPIAADLGQAFLSAVEN